MTLTKWLKEIFSDKDNPDLGNGYILVSKD